MINITEKAISEIKLIIQNKNVPEGYGLRLLVEGGGGCGGARFRLGFDKKKDDDESFFVSEIPVFYQKKTLLFLIGITLDYEERTTEKGFVFRK